MHASVTEPAVRHCPAVLIAAPASNQGKTTVTAALARFHRNQGRRVRVFKAGPDFLDPMIHRCASGLAVDALDLWMVGESACQQALYRAAGEADLILIECGMGLFDGTPSSADLAETFGVPVLAVIDASAMAQTFGALAHGLASYRPGLPFAGVLANRVGSAHHAALVRQSLPPGLRFFGAIPRDAAMQLPDRHLGLVQADEVEDLDARLEAAAAVLADAGVTELPPPVAFEAVPVAEVPRLLEGQRIGIARDAAFAFIYPANLALLEAMGAELQFFSPLTDSALPAVDSLWLPGGYPELHLAQLAANRAMKAALRAFYQADKPILAECGGMLYLFESLTDTAGQRGSMVGLLPGSAIVEERLVGLGMHSLALEGGLLRGHAFHYSRINTPLSPAALTECRHSSRAGEAVYRQRSLTASYLHSYFPADPALVARLLGAASLS